MQTILKETKKEYGPFDAQEANLIAKGLIQKNIDDFYHHACVIKSDNLTK